MSRCARHLGWALSRAASLLALAAAGALALAGASAAALSTGQVRVGSTTPLPSGARITGSMPASAALHMTVVLQSQDPAGLASLARTVSTPGDPQFRNYLTAAQFAQRFGAAPAAIAAVRSALAAARLQVGTVTANGLTIPISATAAQVQRAFSVSLNRVELSGGRLTYANAQAPALPAGISHYVQGVVGLSDTAPDGPAGRVAGRRGAPRGLERSEDAMHRPASAQVQAGDGTQPCAAASAASLANAGAGQVGYTADAIASAYGLSDLYTAGDFGQGQTVALFEQQPYDAADLAAYQQCYGTHVAVTNVDVDGGPGPYVSPLAGGVGDDESTLDIEQVIGLAPGASIIDYQGVDPVADASSTIDIISTIVSEDRAKVISSSYGACEALTGPATIGAENMLLQEAAVQGQSFFISSGDSGANMCFQSDPGNQSLSVIDPGGQPYATGVGGTTLYTSTGTGCPCSFKPGDTPVEGVWNDGFRTVGAGASATGGGISSFFAMPSYQSGAPAALNVIGPNSSSQPCGGVTLCREVPDVAADADPLTGYTVFSDGNWGIVGGTSAAAPLWAAYTALVNAQAACRGVSIGFANPSLYRIAATGYAGHFSDVTARNPKTLQASNDALYQLRVGANPDDLYPVGAGYDMATGLGSMIAPALAASLCALRAPVYSVTVANPGAQLSFVGRGVSLKLHASDSGGAGLSFSAAGLPAGLAVNASTGVISGTPRRAGASTVTVAAADGFANSGSARFTWTVVKPGPPRISGASLRGVRKRAAKLRFTITAGTNAPALAAVSVSVTGGLSLARVTRRTLSAGVSVGGVKFTGHVAGARLTLAFAHPVGRTVIALGRALLKVSSRLAGKVQSRRVRQVTVAVRAVDAGGSGTSISLKLKV